MQSEYVTTFLGIKPEDIDDFLTIRHRFDSSPQYQLMIKESELRMQEEKYLYLIKEQDNIEKEIEQFKSSKKIIDQTEQLIPFPYQSLTNLRHWRKSPKSLRIFFQALSCFFSISNEDFFNELKVNQQLIRKIASYHPSAIVMDEFRTKYANLKEFSLEYLRKKSFDAYRIAIWIHTIDENERLNRMKQKETQLVDYKIKSLKKNNA